ncbi:MAG: MarR family winged helix-turn-helix transcriptional regulator [Candidatus Poribacteria bacterium]
MSRNFAGFVSEVKELILEFVKLYNILDRDEKACYGVTVQQCYTLLAFERNGKMTMNELSAELGLSSSTMTRNVDILARRGYIERIRDDNDRRLVLVQLTESGRELTAKLRQCEGDFFAEALRTIPESEWGNVASSLQLLLTALKSKDCCQWKITNF